MRSRKLYIIGGNDFKTTEGINKNNSTIIFFDKQSDYFLDQFLLIKDLRKKQNFLRKKWIQFQEEVFSKIKKKLDGDKDYYYLLGNFFFEASPNKTQSIYKFFKLYLIIDFIKKKKTKKIYLINISNDIKNFFYDNYKILSISLEIVDKKIQGISYEKVFKNNVIFTLFNLIFKEFKKGKINKIPIKKKSNKVVISYYYPGSHIFKKNIISKYFEEVSLLLNNDYDWLFLYVGNISKIKYENKVIENGINLHGFLDSYFSLVNFFKIIPNYLSIRKKLNSLSLEKLFFFEEINYSNLIKNQWLTYNSSPLLNLLIFEKKFLNFLSSNPQLKEVIYLMEFQPWEQMLNKVANKYNIKTKGIIHSVVRSNMMNYYHSKKIHRYLYLPNYVGANSDFSKLLLTKNGFAKKQIHKIEAQRFNYLLDYKRKINKKKSKSDKTILIITSIIPEETYELLHFFALANVRFKKVYIKEHPIFPIKSILKSLSKVFPDYEMISSTVSVALKNADIVYTACGSSVLLESVTHKIPTVSLISLSTLPIPAIEKASNLYYVYDVVSLSNILKKLLKDLNSNNFEKDRIKYLYLGKNLKLWRKFLKK